MGWISGQTDYGYFLSGMSLLVLAAFCFRSQTLPSRRSPELPLAPLGAFALCHALHEWSFLVLAILRSGEPWRDLLPGGFLFLSLLCLLEFGRRLTSPLIPLKTWSWRLYAPLCLLAPLGVWLGLDVEVWAGLFLALPAAFYALRGMIRLSARQQAGDRKLALGLGGVIALHPLLPALWPLCSATLASGTLRTGAGLAVQLLHASLALLAALLVWGYSGAAKRRLLHGGLFLLAMVTIMGAGWALTCFLGRVADLQIKTETYSRTSTIAAFLQDDLSDVDQAARALSSSVAVAAALGSGRPGELQRASLELERYRKSLGITSCFLLDRSGTLVAAADLRPGAAQIGRSYAFRPYFQGALAGRQSHYFALSKASGERCFFAAAPVLGHTGAVIGVAVGMRGVEGVEVEFQKYPEVALVSPEGIVFISSQKRFLFRSLWPVPREQRVRLAASGQFGPLSFVPLLEREPPPRSFLRLEGREMYARRMPIGSQGWSVLFFEPAALISEYRIFGIAVTCTVALLVLCCFVVLISHRESRRATEQLRGAKEEWERTFDAVPDLIAIIGKDQRVRRINRSMAERLGIQPAEAVGRLCYHLLGCGSEPSPGCPHLQVLQSGSAASVQRYHERLQGHFIVSSSPILSPQGGLEVAVHVMRDVTEQIRLEQSLKVSAERLTLATEGANQAVWEWDMVLDRCYVDQRFNELIGYTLTPEQLNYQFFLSVVHPEDRALIADRIREHVEGKSSMYLAEFRLVSGSGQVRNLMGRGKVVRRAEDGTPLAMAGVMLDVSQQKRLAEEVNRIRHLESVGILAGGLSHDFNNVLNVVCGNVTFARMLAGEESPAAEALGDAEQACERALELGRRLQTLAKGGLPVREPVALAQLAASAAEAVLVGSPIHWRVSAAEGLFPVQADPRQLRQVLESLLWNARDAVEAGGAITVELKNVKIEAESALPVQPGPFVCASIADDGKGIGAEDLLRIFDPYFSTKESYQQKGMGLGLPICHVVIKRHQGHITVESQVGRGTTVAVYLPAAA